MTLKKMKIIGMIGVFLISFLCHFLYQWFPNDLFAIFFPVNESVWEHMKIIFTSFIFYGIIESIFMYPLGVKQNNTLLSMFVTGFGGILLFLMIYLPIYYRFGEHLMITLILLLITICIMEFISYLLMKIKSFPILNMISFILIIVIYVIFGYLTYHPIKKPLFFDSKEEKYGIHYYRI